MINIKKNLVFLMFILVIIGNLSNVSALTASMGNSRMVLRLEVGESVEKYILVRNVNDVAVDIDLLAIGDIDNSDAVDIEIRDSEFSLEPGDEKRAYFVIKALTDGTTENKINVRFSSNQDGGVGLSSTIILIAGDGENEDNFVDLGFEDDKDDDKGFFEDIKNDEDKENKGNSILKLLSISSAVLVLVFFVMVIFISGKGKKNKAGKKGRSPSA